MRFSTLVALAITFAGCLPVTTSVAPQPPESSTEYSPLALRDVIPEDPTEPISGQALRLLNPSATLDQDALRITANIYPGNYGYRYEAQVFLDTNQDGAGYGPGADYVASMTERDPATNVFPVRHASNAGFGAIAGYGDFETPGVRLEITIPREAIGMTEGVDLMLFVIGLNDGRQVGPGEFRHWTGTAVLQGPVAIR